MVELPFSTAPTDDSWIAAVRLAMVIGCKGRRFDGDVRQMVASLQMQNSYSWTQPFSTTEVWPSRDRQNVFMGARNSANPDSGGMRIESLHLFALPTYDVVRRKIQGRRHPGDLLPKNATHPIDPQETDIWLSA